METHPTCKHGVPGANPSLLSDQNIADTLRFLSVGVLLLYLLPAFAALWRARVGRGVVTGGLHTRSFTLELFAR